MPGIPTVITSYSIHYTKLYDETAENYPVPPDPEYAGRTEEIVGRWMKTKPRDALEQDSIGGKPYQAGRFSANPWGS